MLAAIKNHSHLCCQTVVTWVLSEVTDLAGARVGHRDWAAVCTVLWLSGRTGSVVIVFALAHWWGNAAFRVEP